MKPWIPGTSPGMTVDLPDDGRFESAAPDMGPSQPHSVRRIAGLIRLDWDQPPAVEQDHLDTEPELEPEPEPDAPVFSASFEASFATSFSWPAYAAATLAVTPPAPVAVQPAPAPVAPIARRAGCGRGSARQRPSGPQAAAGAQARAGTPA